MPNHPTDRAPRSQNLLPTLPAATTRIPRRKIKAIQNRLQSWYDCHARDLPWRQTTDPYHIWVSEVMLQQTQVSTVVNYYERFIDRFFTVRELARATTDEVLKYWQGLGYYRRAMNLHEAAGIVVAEHGGRVPDDEMQLRRLPGVGRYIAGAIRSIAFGRTAAIVEANSARVLARLFAVRGSLASTTTHRTLWALADQLVECDRPAVHNQALMELGALVCAPLAADCEACPVHDHCQAARLGVVHELPEVARRRAAVDVSDAAAIVRVRGRVLIVQRPMRSRWGGLWELPRVTVPPGSDPRQSLKRHLLERCGIHARIGEKILTLKHSVTHHRITLSCYEAELASSAAAAAVKEGEWIESRLLADYPCSAPQRRVFDFLQGLRSRSVR